MIFLIAFVFSAVICLVCFVQLLYLESMRLRARDYPSLDFFKTELQKDLGFELEAGALVFSLLKHSLLVLCGAALVAAGLAHRGSWLYALEGAPIAWFTMLGASYLLPQILYRRTSGRWALPLVPFIKFLALLLRPLTALLNFLHSLFELSSPTPEGEEKSNGGGDIEALITAGREEGLIEEADRHLIRSVVEFGDKRVREVMTPRRSIVAIEASRTLEDLRQLTINEQYSRIPVFEETIDRMVGFVHVKDLFELDEEERAGKCARDIMRPIHGVPETKPVADLLREMQRDGRHIVYVVDEYGGVAGLATMEDLMEEVFGEIRDEHEPAHDIEHQPDGSVIVSGSFDVDHLEELFGFKRSEETSAATVGGLATEWFGAVPKPGQEIIHDGIVLEVIAADNLRVDRVRIRRADSAADPAQPA
jgi:CBS domain containing-hemolysin-like protein